MVEREVRAQAPDALFTTAEIAEAALYYRTRVARQPRLDFNKRWLVQLIRPLCALAFLDKRRLSDRGLRAEQTIVTFGGTSVRVRIIRPTTPPRGIVVDIHGGGWTLARAVNNDAMNIAFVEAGFAVVSVDYSYAPRRSIAFLIDECATALAWALDKGEAAFGAAGVVLNGDSAGAHLALSAAQRLRGTPGYANLKGMVLRYGCYDLSATPSVRAASADTLVFYGPSLPAFFERISGGRSEVDRRDPAISPLYGPFDGLPPALLAVGDADPLIDDSRLAWEKLAAHGVPAELIVVPDAPHSFDRLPTQVASRFNAYACAWMKQHVQHGRDTGEAGDGSIEEAGR